jgi:hypothetical protein
MHLLFSLLDSNRPQRRPSQEIRRKPRRRRTPNLTLRQICKPRDEKVAPQLRLRLDVFKSVKDDPDGSRASADLHTRYILYR